MTAKTKAPPWKKKAPAGTKQTKLTAAQKAAAKARADKAGRRYPNLVDNMWAASKGKPSTTKKSTTKKSTGKKSTGKKSTRSKKA